MNGLRELWRQLVVDNGLHEGLRWLPIKTGSLELVNLTGNISSLLRHKLRLPERREVLIGITVEVSLCNIRM
jgi:hypothetical protein